MKPLAWALKVFIFLSPAIIICYWGSSYIADCWQLLAAPAKPVQFYYKAPIGSVKVWSESYSIDLKHGSITLYRPRVVDPRGALVVKATFAQLTNLHWRQGVDQVLRLRIVDLNGRLVRFPNGKFELLDLLPPRHGPSSKIPFEVLVQRANVSLIDFAGGDRWIQAASSPEVKVAGVGSDWIANGTLNLPKIGSIDALVQNTDSEGLHIHARTGGLDATGLVRHLLKAPESKRYVSLAKLSLDSIAVSGPFNIFVPRGKEFSVDASLSARAKGVAYDRYRIDSAKFNGEISESGAKGNLDITDGRATGRFQGAGSWKNGETAAGQVAVSAPAPQALPAWVQRMVPKGLEFRNGRFSGWATFAKGAETRVEGTVGADRLEYRKQTLFQPIAQIQASPELIRVRLKRGTLAGISPSGAASIDLRSKTISAFVSAPATNLEAVSKIAKLQGISGNANVQAVIRGPIDDPLVNFLASGSATYVRHQNSLKFGPEQVDVEGSFRRGIVQIDRGLVTGPSGLLVVSGHTSPDGQRIAMKVAGRAIQPGAYFPDLSASVNLSAAISGNIQHPVATGRLEAYDVAYEGQTVPAAVMEFTADRNHLDATDLFAVSGTTKVAGLGSYVYRTGAISGHLNAQNVQLTQYLGSEFAGSLNVPDVLVFGTLKDPKYIARVEGANLVARQIKVDSITADLQGSRQGVNVSNAVAKLAGGEAKVEGNYDFHEKTGVFTGSTTSLNLTELAPELGDTVSFTGSTAAKSVRATIRGNSFSAEASGRFDGIDINGAVAGDGNWTVTTDGVKTHATLSIGQILPELRVLDIDATYNSDTQYVEGSIDADRARIADLVGATERYVPESVTNDPTIFTGLSGDLTVGVKFQGPLKKLDVETKTLQVAHLAYKGQNFGALTANGLTRKSGVWNVPAAEISGPEGVLTAQGAFTENGPIAMKASGSNLIISDFSTFAPSLATNPGTGAFKVDVTGLSSGPDVSGSAAFSHLARASSLDKSFGTTENDLMVTVSSFGVSPKTGTHVAATYAFGGFTGTFDGTAPFSYSKGLADGPIDAKFVLDKRLLSNIPMASEILDPAGSDGSIGGEIDATGSLDRMIYTGEVALTAKKLGIRFTDPAAYIRKVDDAFNDVSVSVKLNKDGGLGFSAKATEQRTGTISASVGTTTLDATSLLTGDFQQISRKLMESAVSGQIVVDHFKFRQGAPGGYVSAEVNGSVDVSGTVSKPSFGTRSDPGKFTLSQLDTTIPTLPSGSGQESVASIDPSFDIQASLATPATVRSATAELSLTGTGSLTGRLAAPHGAAALVVQRGTIRLPGGTVRLESGGTVDFEYRSDLATASNTNLNVDLVGKTAVTAIRYNGQNSQRYDITLDIHGDLLKSQGLQMQAISDPPDLGSDDALALLGQKDLFQSLGSTDQNEAQKRVTDALAGFALPTVLDPVTSPLARSIGLDYISFEYNQLESTTVNVGRSLTPDFTIQYRQQVGTPPPGFRSIYDARLVFSPRRVPGVLRRFTLSVGTDQDRPWKIALEYGTRFGGPSAGTAPRKVLISP